MIFLEEIKKEATKESLKDRFSFKTTGKIYSKVRNVSAFISGLSFVISKMPLNLPENFTDWNDWIYIVSGFIAFGSHLNKSKK